MKCYVYILYSQSKNKYYIGYSQNLEDRVAKHNTGATPSTKAGKPWILVYKEEFIDKNTALRRELAIKKMKSRKYIERLISGHSNG